MAVLSVMGPALAVAALEDVTDADLSNESLPLRDVAGHRPGYARVRASRITYVGELGWELYIPTEFAAGVFDAIDARGAEHGLRHAGYHALNSLRMEKGYRHWGHDISPDETPLEAGLGFAVAWDKPGGFIGRDALLEQRELGVPQRLAQFRLLGQRPPAVPQRADLARWRPRRAGSPPACTATPSARRWRWGTSKAPAGVTDPDFVLSGTYELEVACDRIPAEVSLRPFYDPDSQRIRA